MESRARLFGHPLHPVLIVYPRGLLGMAVVFDLLALFAISWWQRRDDPGANLNALNSLSNRPASGA